ncbi:hypothetical protein VNO77_19420 [Canavalia gladiata]|uniref:Uncharacterized protein n=1 Tax=Canavalia gladiata TaxID=3824 RepID=A0AAN9LMP1_CANGL
MVLLSLDLDILNFSLTTNLMRSSVRMRKCNVTIICEAFRASGNRLGVRELLIPEKTLAYENHTSTDKRRVPLTTP